MSPSDSNITISTGTTISLSADNGEPIVVTRRAPESADPRGAVIICPAIATPARFYDAVATWLASRGFLVYNFDYQGYGASARTALKDVTADYFTWAADAATVVDAVKDDLAELGHGTLPLTWLGHSLGSQYLGFTDTTKLDKAVITCGGTGWWQNSDPPSRYFVPLLWWVIAPVLSRTLGYFPGKKLRILGDIPGTVMLQWANFCRHREYLWDVHPEHVQTFADVTIPVTSITFSDDVIMSAKASEHLESYYTGTDLDARRYSPEELDRRSVNHMGLFRRGREDLWERLIEPELATVETR